jgi:hypothetical protein|eukprot:COSAG01_NODE_4220_length_5228_cov_8.279392_2_plen_333_part_00
MVVGASFEEAVNGAVPPIVPPPSGSDSRSGRKWRVSAGHGAPQRIYWNNVTTGTARGHVKLSDAMPFHGRSAMEISFDDGVGSVGVSNRGLGNEGLVFEAGKLYEGFFFASSSAPVTLEVALRDYTTVKGRGTDIAKQSWYHPGGGQYLRFNFSMVPRSATSCANMSAADAMVNGGSVDCKLPGMHGLGRDHICVKCSGEISVSISQPGHVAIDYVFLQPGEWARLGKLPVLKSTIDKLKQMGVTAIRLGGSFTDPACKPIALLPKSDLQFWLRSLLQSPSSLSALRHKFNMALVLLQITFGSDGQVLHGFDLQSQPPGVLRLKPVGDLSVR